MPQNSRKVEIRSIFETERDSPENHRVVSLVFILGKY